MRVTLLHNLDLELGEGLNWNHKLQKFFFVDIIKGDLHSISREGLHTKLHNFKKYIGWVLPGNQDNELIIGLRDEIIIFDLDRMIVKNKIWQSDLSEKNLRLNDAKKDLNGGIYFGIMDMNFETSSNGSLNYFKDGRLTCLDKGLKIPNGPAINFLDNTLYHTDSYKRTIYQYKIINNGELSSREIFYKVPKNKGFPDGMDIDVQENLWVAHWGSGEVSVINKHGILLDTIKIPSKYVTNVCFGGEKLDRVFVSTALNHEKQNQIDPINGSIYEISDHKAQSLQKHLILNK